MTVDVRAFRYPMEVLLRRRRWEEDAALARLGRAQADIDAASGELKAERQRLADDSARLAQGARSGADLRMHTVGVQWLAWLRQRIARAEAALQELRARHRELAAEHARCAAGVELLEGDRRRCMADFARDAGRRAASAADREWLSRQAPTEHAREAR